MGKYFGTDGFRGEANVVLTVEHAFKVGRYLGWYFGREKKARIVIGKDTRRSSYMFEYALASGLTASGADAYLLHVTTTPSVSYVVRTEDFDCGIMISASHNPFYDNGSKGINGQGHKIEAEVEEQIEAYIDGKTEELPLAVGEHSFLHSLVSLSCSVTGNCVQSVSKGLKKVYKCPRPYNSKKSCSFCKTARFQAADNRT